MVPGPSSAPGYLQSKENTSFRSPGHSTGGIFSDPGPKVYLYLEPFRPEILLGSDEGSVNRIVFLK